MHEIRIAGLWQFVRTWTATGAHQEPPGTSAELHTAQDVIPSGPRLGLNLVRAPSVLAHRGHMAGSTIGSQKCAPGRETPNATTAIAIDPLPTAAVA